MNIPIGIGGGLGNYIAGILYARVGEKANLSLKYLLEHTPFGDGKVWDGKIATLEELTGIARTEAFAKLQEVVGQDGPACTRLLWETYNPQYYTWLPFAAIGVLATIALAIYGRMAKRWSDMNA